MNWRKFTPLYFLNNNKPFSLNSLSCFLSDAIEYSTILNRKWNTINSQSFIALSFYVASFYNTFMHNHSVMATPTASLFLISGSSFPNPYRTISSVLIHFVSLSFSGSFPLFEAMDMVLLIYETDLHTFENLKSLPKL